jgi:hypothetical protein
MITYMEKHTPRRLGRPLTEQVRRDCNEIGRLLARGYGEHEIRAELGLTRRIFEDRVKKLKQTSMRPGLMWVRYYSAQQAELRTLSEIEADALQADPPDRRAAMAAVAARCKVRQDTVEMGLNLGIYTRGSIQDCEPDPFSDLDLTDRHPELLIPPDPDDCERLREVQARKNHDDILKH